MILEIEIFREIILYAFCFLKTLDFVLYICGGKSSGNTEFVPRSLLVVRKCLVIELLMKLLNVDLEMKETIRYNNFSYSCSLRFEVLKERKYISEVLNIYFNL